MTFDIQSYLSKHKQLIKECLSDEVTIDIFDKEFHKLFRDTRANDITPEIYQILERIMDLIYAFEPDEKIRKANSDYIGESQLREELKKALDELEKLIKTTN